MDSNLVSLLIQIPLVGAFMWFSLRLSSDYRADINKRDTQWQAFIKEQNELHEKRSDQQNEIWRHFIQELVERSSESEDMTSQRLTELAGIIKQLLDKFESHDSRTYNDAARPRRN